MTFSVIIPANNEAEYIGPCLESLLAQTPIDATRGEVEVIVACNACSDDTAAIARGFSKGFAARGWSLVVLDDPAPGKTAALNRADAIAKGAARGYLDADIVCEPPMIAEVIALLARPEATYATGRLRIAKAKSWITHFYGDLYGRMPFPQSNAPGAGFFAVNAAGRARWSEFPDIISDDTYVRLQFEPSERLQGKAGYYWPLVEGYRALVKVRRRQMQGDFEFRDTYPELRGRFGHRQLSRWQHFKLFCTVPISYCVYALIIFSVKFKGVVGDSDSDRGR